MAFIPGTTGADNLVGTDLADTFDGGAGNDTLSGGLGDDTYLFGRGDGHDIIQRFFESASNKLNILQFKAGVLPTEVAVVRNGGDLIVSIVGTADRVTIDDFFSSINNPSNNYNPVQEFRFSNGTTWNLDTIRAKAFVGTTGADNLEGTVLADTIDGGAGNDTLNGGFGDDTYLFGRGDGHDIIQRFLESASNKLNVLQFKAGVLPTEVAVVRNGGDLIVSIVGTADRVTIDDFFSSINNPSNNYNPVQEFRFSNGTTWNLDTIRAKAFVGTTGADNLEGTVLADTIDGGAGNDTLSGGLGDDTYLFGKGDGYDIIQSFFESASNKLNVLQFKAGVLPTEVVAVQNGRDLIVSIIGTADKVTIDEFFGSSNNPTNSNNPVQEFRFSNGTVWNLSAIQSRVNVGADSPDVLFGTNGADVVFGGGGNDYLYMGEGNDTAYGDAGDDVLFGEAGNDVLVGATGNDYIDGGAGLDYADGGDGNDIFFMGAGNDTAVAGTGNDYFDLGDGDDYADGGAGSDIFLGGLGNDVMVGGAGVDYFDAGAGNDYAAGGDGNDIFLGGAGNDSFDAGQGVDVALGGAGSDTYTVRNTSGLLLVYDFVAGGAEDTIYLTGTGVSSFAQVQARLSFNAGNYATVLSIDADTSVWLVGVTPTQLTAADFVFA
jgi:Ca2+-binding RTX toxin-like protein